PAPWCGGDSSGRSQPPLVVCRRRRAVRLRRGHGGRAVSAAVSASRHRRPAADMTGVGAVAAWTSPMLVIAVVARVTAGGVEAPLFVLAALAAPLLALLAGSGPRHARSGFVLTVTAAVVACLLGAGFRAVTDLGQVLGLEMGATLGAAAALVLVMTSWPDHHRVAATALVLGAGALLVAIVALGIAVSAAP